MEFAWIFVQTSMDFMEFHGIVMEFATICPMEFRFAEERKIFEWRIYHDKFISTKHGHLAKRKVICWKMVANDD